MSVDISENMECYIIGDQPMTCGICGARTSFEEMNNGSQLHECLNQECSHKFVAVDDRFNA